jgi:pimeloyl-ACP methyl ester carboxylesterase
MTTSGQTTDAAPADSGERIVRANGVDLCVQTFGAPEDPAILLLCGSASSMLGWPAEFCLRLASAGRFVIRYDFRDTGRSVTYEPGSPGYTGSDLVEDAIGLLDALGVRAAHLAGISMGGALAQVAALKHPGRVASLTLIATSPVSPFEEGHDLPKMAPETAAKFAALAAPDWSDRDAVIEYLVAMEVLCAGRERPGDAAALRETAARTFDRAANLPSMTNHFSLPPGDDELGPDRLRAVKVPALVIHGKEDPLFPFEHGLALERALPDATLLPLEDTGHELPRSSWDTVVPALTHHTTRHTP